MDQRLPLSTAKARLSEVVRSVRETGEPVVITVDGVPAARVVPVPSTPRRLRTEDVATFRVVADLIRRLEEDAEPFDAVGLVHEGRR